MSEPADYRVRLMVSLEKARVEKAHGLEFHSAHEALGVLSEEFDEFKAQVYLKPESRDRESMIRELVQIATTAQIYASQLLGGNGVPK